MARQRVLKNPSRVNGSIDGRRILSRVLENRARSSGVRREEVCHVVDVPVDDDPAIVGRTVLRHFLVRDETSAAESWRGACGGVFKMRGRASPEKDDGLKTKGGGVQICIFARQSSGSDAAVQTLSVRRLISIMSTGRIFLPFLPHRAHESD
jgi:hypothetical protein